MCIACSKFGSVRAARAPQDDLLCFVLGRWRAKVRGKQSVVLRDKKNPLWDTELQFFTRSVPFWQGRTVVRGSFPETFLEVSVTYDNRSSSGKAAYLVVKHVPLPREKW